MKKSLYFILGMIILVIIFFPLILTISLLAILPKLIFDYDVTRSKFLKYTIVNPVNYIERNWIKTPKTTL